MLLEFYLNSQTPPFNPPNPDFPFTILEDMKLLYYIHSYIKTEDIDLTKAFSSLIQEKILNRTLESLQNRYELLKLITIEQFQDIYSNYLRHNGTEGFLNLEKTDDFEKIRIKSITKHLMNRNSTDSVKKINQIKNIDLYDEESNNVNDSIKKTNQIRNIGFSEERSYVHKSLPINASSSKRKATVSCEICQRNAHILSYNNNSHLLSDFEFEKEKEVPMKSNEKIEIRRDFETNKREVSMALDGDLINLKETIEIFQKKYNRTTIEIIDIFEKVSGKVSDVDEYFRTNEEGLLWNEFEDEILENAKEKDECSFKILIKYKGMEKIKQRAAFKGVSLPFEV